MLFNRLPKHNSFFACVKTVFRTTLCPRKKGATDFFAVTFTNIDGFSEFFRAQLHKRMLKLLAQKFLAIHLLCCYHTV